MWRMDPVLSGTWFALVLLRCLWVIIPQKGYLHPDEFFQTTEIVAGDVLGMQTERPWEYNSSFPLRSIVLPSILCRPGYHFLSLLRDYGVFREPLTPPTYLLLIAPRITIVTISIAIDCLLGKTAHNFGIGQRSTILCYATSYVCFVHLTRTFTNTFEAFLFVLLLYFCSKSNPWCSSSSKKRPSCMEACAVCFVLVAGFFNRPTFLAFAAVPVMKWFLYWYKRSILRKIYECIQFGLLFTIIFIVLDTAYFRDEPVSVILKNLTSSNNLLEEWNRILCVTPYNFLLYNMHPMHLAEHGVHSRLTHFFINLPMLFGPCAILCYGIAVVAVRNYSSQQSLRDFLLQLIFIPVLALSGFIHQEARFLVPVLVPLSLLCGTTIFGRKFPWRLLRILWLLFNVIGAVVFGILHQGGVIASIGQLQTHLNTQMQAKELSTSHHVVYFHTYMPPVHLFGKPSHGNGSVTDLIHIHDLKGTTFSELERTFQQFGNDNAKSNLILVTPATVAAELCVKTTLRLKHLYSMWPHVSFEDPPNLPAASTGSIVYGVDCRSNNAPTMWDNIKDALSLYIIEIETL